LIVSLEMSGSDAFVPISHLPEYAVLGVGRIMFRSVVVGEFRSVGSARRRRRWENRPVCAPAGLT